MTTEAEHELDNANCPEEAVKDLQSSSQNNLTTVEMETGDGGVLFPHATSKNETIISWLSILFFLVFFLFLRSSAAPFLHPRGDARRTASKSIYYSLSIFLSLWVVAATTLTILPHLTSHHNEIIAAALFFPMSLSTIGALLFGRLTIRSFYYLYKRSQIIYKTIKDNRERKGILWRVDLLRKIRISIKNKSSRMVAFHRPFRVLFKNSMILSILLSFLYAHCWSRSLSIFKIRKDDGASVVCTTIFSPFSNKESQGADEHCIWYFWGISVLLLLLSFAQDEFAGVHCRSEVDHLEAEDDVNDDGEEFVKEVELASNENGDTFSLRTGSSQAKHGKSSRRRKTWRPFDSWVAEEPQDTMPMVPWLSFIGATTVIDIVLQLKVFVGRFDARTMQPALQHSSCRKREIDKQVKSSQNNFDDLKGQYPGCVFDYSSKLKNDDVKGYWFDFMADCGDGFNSSYHVARTLAQKDIIVKQKDKAMVLPRGELLVLGGDLAYPNPTKESFEKRFFRTFEDAMPPPPSFRRTNIATAKPDLPVKGWNCGGSNNTDDTKGGDKLSNYTGPATFIIPGNHDWYDGLASFTRFILCRNWLGGWIIPQERSYFALKLPKGWWVFGLDCALSADIDIEQFKFFVSVAKTVGDKDSVIIVNHEPHWVTDFDNNRYTTNNLSEENITELMNRHLRGKVRARLAGDLHHYTRHVPVDDPPKRQQHKSFSFDEIDTTSKSINNDRFDALLEPFEEENKPELIVSGGGGAFLHGTHTFDKNIEVGENKLKYSRVSAFPSEKVSQCISLLNMWHFRWRNWRFDIVWIVYYLGISSSLFPLCGLYADYEAFNPSQNYLLIPIWTLQKIGLLLGRIFFTENLSLFYFLAGSFICIANQAGVEKMRPAPRFLWGFCLAISHTVAAITCLLFVEYSVEWVVQHKVVDISPSASPTTLDRDGIDLASSLYSEYNVHFSHIFANFTDFDEFGSSSSSFLSDQSVTSLSGLESIQKIVIGVANQIYMWVKSLPLLSTTIQLFDLPGLIAGRHQQICSILCSNNAECLLAHDPGLFMSVERKTFVMYALTMSLYYIIIAIPIAGGIFGTWLAMSLNIFHIQNDLGFSSLQLQHWKNYLKLHVTMDGDLEIYGIGLRRIPTRWMKDPEWSGSTKEGNDGTASWAWERPSKWIPMNRNTDKFSPEMIDYTLIKKRRIESLACTS